MDQPLAPAVRVHLMLADLDGRPGVRIVVDDDGVGLPEGLEDRVWNLDVTTKRKGSGIGLPIVRQTVMSHRGTVAASNRPNGGTRFEVWIPCSGGEAEARPEESA